MKRATLAYAAFVLLVLVVLLGAALPIAASDLFRMPYSRVWDWIHRYLQRVQYTYNPSGGGETPQFPPWQNPGDAGLAYEDLRLTTTDHVRLAAWYVPASSSGAPSVILAHGLQDSKWTMLRLVPWLHRAGYNVMLFDFRGHGESEHRPTTLGRQEVLDVEAALDWLQAKGVADQVFGLGMSLGAASLVNTAAQDSRIDGLVLDSLFAEWRNVDFARGYRLPPEWLVPDVPDPELTIRRVRVPVLIIHGTADILTKVGHAYRLYEAANPPKRLWVNDSGHAWSAWTYPERYQAQVLGFLAAASAQAQDASPGVLHSYNDQSYPAVLNRGRGVPVASDHEQPEEPHASMLSTTDIVPPIHRLGAIGALPGLRLNRGLTALPRPDLLRVPGQSRYASHTPPAPTFSFKCTPPGWPDLRDYHLAGGPKSSAYVIGWRVLCLVCSDYVHLARPFPAAQLQADKPS